MTITYSLLDANGRDTELGGLHENLPPGLSPADNRAGGNPSPHKLASLRERGH
jgi:hypothetical protein